MFIAIWLGALLAAALLVATQMVRCKRPLFMALKSALIGIGSLLLINLFSGATGFEIPVNFVTVSGSVVLGAPGTLMLLVLNLLI